MNFPNFPIRLATAVLYGVILFELSLLVVFLAFTYKIVER